MLLNEKKKEIQIKNDATTISMTKDEIKLKAKNIVLDGSTKINLKTKDAAIKASGSLKLDGKNVKMSGWLEREDTDLLFFENIFKEGNENEQAL